MNQDILGTRYRQLLGYLAELDRLRSSIVSKIEGHPDAIDLSVLPNHPSVEWTPSDPASFLSVTRCEKPPSPALFESLEGWVNYIPNQVMSEPTIRTSKVKDGQELSWEEFGVSDDWDTWLFNWLEWAEKVRPAYEARDLYIKLYELHATLERSSEQLELVAADVAVALKSVDHPILINPVRLEFDVEQSRITVGCLEEPAQIYGDAIRTVLPEAGNSIAKARKEVTENPDIWAFGGEEVDRFATRFIQGADSEGEFIKGTPQPDRLSARRHPWLLLGKRATGLAELAEGLISKFEEDGRIPHPIQPVLVDREEPAQSWQDFCKEPDEDENSFFTKPANSEQLAILRSYRRSRCVHVQGPPGTGKTHTIANLIGHFLAEGKSVLVTSERAQALSVLREKLVEELRPLCVSLVGSDAGEGLKAGMRGLFEKLSDTEPDQLASDVERLKLARGQTIEELHRARYRMKEIIENEHLPIEIPGWRGSPADAGRYVNKRRVTQGWIPGELSVGSEPPLSQTEFLELFDLFSQYSKEIVPEVRKLLPPVAEVPEPADFQGLLENIEKLVRDVPTGPEGKVPEFREQNGDHFDAKSMLDLVEASLSKIENLGRTYRELANRFDETPSLLTAWESWRTRANEILEKEQPVRTESAAYGFVIKGETGSVLSGAKQFLEYVSKTGRDNCKPRFLNPQDKLLFKSVSSKRRLGNEQCLRALVHKLEFEDQRDRFRDEIQAEAQNIGISSFGSEEAEYFVVRDPSLKTALHWKKQEFDPINAGMACFGFGFEVAETLAPAVRESGGPVDQRAWWLSKVIRPVLLRHLHSKELTNLSKRKDVLIGKARSWKEGDPSVLLQSLADAIMNEDLPAYCKAYEGLEELRAAAEPVQRRDALLERIRSRAEVFAKRLEDGLFEASEAQGTLADAWTYALISQELQRRSALSLSDAKRDLERLKQKLDHTTVKLAESLAWLAQHKRVTQPVRSALSRFHEAQRKVGRGTGKRAPELHSSMRNSMREAKDAFPAWIMPLYEVAKSFDFTKTRFDVVIVDESSQLSAVGLITLLIADSAIVVGDDEQTEPSLVGIKFDSVKSLIQEHLVDFTDRILWSPDSSLYSFAGRFGATVALREHFRCVPQIISFSSKLCYQGRIQPLRDARGVVQLPHVVPIHCGGEPGQNLRDVNESEASEIVSLLIACYEQPEYQGQTFGVISLKGSADTRGTDPQTSRITELLQSAFGADEYEKLVAKSRLKFGVPPAFQGDERDVVFISVGDSPVIQADGQPGTLRMTSGDSLPGGQYKKRLNVAVSRARNQVWVVHSFSHFEAELKPDDLRRQLLEFAYAPEQWLESTQAVNYKAESPFEEDVYADLVRRGYAVRAQVPVGHYRIDLVAEDDDARVAIECDGDAYHQDAAADLSRQIVLERCGWKFVRIRGSEYYRDPEGSIDRIIRELTDLGVKPTNSQITQKDPDGELLRRVLDRAQDIRAEIATGNPIILVHGSDPQRGQVEPEEPLFEPEISLTQKDVVDLDDVDKREEFPNQCLPGEEEPLADANTKQVETNMVTLKGFPIRSDEYIQFTETGYADPKRIEIGEIQKALVKIVKVEGPATEATVIDRYRVATGYGKLRGPTRERISTALRNTVENGYLSMQPDYPGSRVLVYSLPGEPKVHFRTRGPRELHDVPMGEIVILASEILRANVAFDEENQFRLILQCYGLKRLTERAEERLRQAYQLAAEKALPLVNNASSDAVGAVPHSITPDPTAESSFSEAHCSEANPAHHTNPQALKPIDSEFAEPRYFNPLTDKDGQIIRVRVLSTSGQVVVTSGTVLGKSQYDDFDEWTVFVEESQDVKKFRSPPATLLRLR